MRVETAEKCSVFCAIELLRKGNSKSIGHSNGMYNCQLRNHPVLLRLLLQKPLQLLFKRPSMAQGRLHFSRSPCAPRLRRENPLFAARCLVCARVQRASAGEGNVSRIDASAVLSLDTVRGPTRTPFSFSRYATIDA